MLCYVHIVEFISQYELNLFYCAPKNQFWGLFRTESLQKGERLTTIEVMKYFLKNIS